MENNQLPTNTEIDINELPKDMSSPSTRGESPIHSLMHKYKLALIVIAIAVIGILGVLYFKNFMGGSDEIVVARVSDTSITRKNVVEEYNTRYSATPVTSFKDIKDKAQTELIDSMVERLILEKEAAKLGITVTEQEITIEVQQEISAGIPESILSQPNEREEIRISLLKDKLREKFVTFRQIDTATIFIPEGPDMQVRFNNARTLLNEFRSDIQVGRSFAEANDIAKQKTYYNRGLVVNETYLTKKDAEMNFLGPTAFSLKKGDVSEVVDSGGGTLGVILVKEAGDYEFGSLEEWLAAEKEKVAN